MLKIVGTLLLLTSACVHASPEILQDHISDGEMLTDVRNHHNLWQGYIHRDGSRRYFHALIDDGVVSHWYEKDRPTDMAVLGQTADAATTLAGVAQGGAELNPLGLAVIPAKYVLNSYVETLSYQECKKGKGWVGAFGWGPAATNVVTLAAGSLSPAGLVVGALAGAWGYQQGMKTGQCELWVGDVVAEQIGMPATSVSAEHVVDERILAQHYSGEEMYDF